MSAVEQDRWELYVTGLIQMAANRGVSIEEAAAIAREQAIKHNTPRHIEPIDNALKALQETAGDEAQRP